MPGRCRCASGSAGARVRCHPHPASHATRTRRSTPLGQARPASDARLGEAAGTAPLRPNPGPSGWVRPVGSRQPRQSGGDTAPQMGSAIATIAADSGGEASTSWPAGPLATPIQLDRWEGHLIAAGPAPFWALWPGEPRPRQGLARDGGGLAAAGRPRAAAPAQSGAHQLRSSGAPRPPPCPLPAGTRRDRSTLDACPVSRRAQWPQRAAHAPDSAPTPSIAEIRPPPAALAAPACCGVTAGRASAAAGAPAHPGPSGRRRRCRARRGPAPPAHRDGPERFRPTAGCQRSEPVDSRAPGRWARTKHASGIRLPAMAERGVMHPKADLDQCSTPPAGAGLGAEAGNNGEIAILAWRVFEGGDAAQGCGPIGGRCHCRPRSTGGAVALRRRRRQVRVTAGVPAVACLDECGHCRSVRTASLFAYLTLFRGGPPETLFQYSFCLAQMFVSRHEALLRAASLGRGGEYADPDALTRARGESVRHESDTSGPLWGGQEEDGAQRTACIGWRGFPAALAKCANQTAIRGRWLSLRTNPCRMQP